MESVENTNRLHDNISFQQVFIDLNFITVLDVPIISSLEMSIFSQLICTVFLRGKR